MISRVLTAVVAASLLFGGTAFAAHVRTSVTFQTRRGQHPVAAETVVWLDPAGSRVPKIPQEKLGPYQIVTRSKMLMPRVLAVPVGATVQFPNDDPISHNLFSLSGANAFDLGLYRRGPGKEVRFTTPGIVTVYCNVHPNMSAVIHVLATPWFTVADENGAADLADVPPGKYILTAWNEQGGFSERTIEVAADGPTGPTDLVIDGRAWRGPATHLNKHGKPYSGPPRDY